jgi:chromatin segregation and condensation protein Rec8/ScpA/Scc1 (kleisin family)
LPDQPATTKQLGRVVGQAVLLRQQRDVDFPLFQLVERELRRRQQLQPYVGRLLLQQRHQPREQHRRQVIRQADMEPTIRGRRIEMPRLDDHPVHVAQHFGQHRAQLHRVRRGDHALALDFEQRIVEVIAQLGQGGTHRRLAEVQPLGGTRDAAFLDEDIKRHEQVEVQSLEAHGYLSGNPLDSYRKK